MFNRLPSELKKIIFAYNKLDSSSKCKNELKNFSNKYKFNNVLNELINSYDNYLNYNQIESINEINHLNIEILTGYILYNRKLQWILFDQFNMPYYSGSINSISNSISNLNGQEYNDVKTKIRFYENLKLEL